ILAGTTLAEVEGTRRAVITVSTQTGKMDITFQNALYVPTYQSNLVSEAILEEQGAFHARRARRLSTMASTSTASYVGANTTFWRKLQRPRQLWLSRATHGSIHSSHTTRRSLRSQHRYVRSASATQASSPSRNSNELHAT